MTVMDWIGKLGFGGLALGTWHHTLNILMLPRAGGHVLPGSQHCVPFKASKCGGIYWGMHGGPKCKSKGHPIIITLFIHFSAICHNHRGWIPIDCVAIPPFPFPPFAYSLSPVFCLQFVSAGSLFSLLHVQKR
jgi:hypothetical protein